MWTNLLHNLQQDTLIIKNRKKFTNFLHCPPTLSQIWTSVEPQKLIFQSPVRIIAPIKTTPFISYSIKKKLEGVLSQQWYRLFKITPDHPPRRMSGFVSWKVWQAAALPRHPVCGGSRRLTRGWASRNEGHRRLDKVGVNAAGRDADSLPKTISSVESEPCLESRTDGPSYLRYLNMAVHSSTLRVTPRPRWRTLLGIFDLLRRFFFLSFFFVGVITYWVKFWGKRRRRGAKVRKYETFLLWNISVAVEFF